MKMDKHFQAAYMCLVWDLFIPSSVPWMFLQDINFWALFKLGKEISFWYFSENACFISIRYLVFWNAFKNIKKGLLFLIFNFFR